MKAPVSLWDTPRQFSARPLFYTYSYITCSLSVYGSRTFHCIYTVNYSNVIYEFYNIHNIHVMRESLQRLLEGTCINLLAHYSQELGYLCVYMRMHTCTVHIAVHVAFGYMYVYTFVTSVPMFSCCVLHLQLQFANLFNIIVQLQLMQLKRFWLTNRLWCCQIRPCYCGVGCILSSFQSQ